ncbi:hypothetical protein KV097_05470 [Mumia sp. zg.B17]|uniref:hypothetical protein n=1 Tax=Mumia sp. zg.B17 TaxID=2855446 RepID=UPI001C6E9260|nr:hypothetical protein [Mumia sp. zg.B17]MBW9205388.1 hypothetical protein [Mumia sp. zg.B17]
MAGASAADADTVDYGPGRVIGGSRAQVENAQVVGIAPDATTFVARALSDRVRVFGPRADGNVKPSHVLNPAPGSVNHESNVDLAVDAAGSTYVLNAIFDDNTYVAKFGPRFTGPDLRFLHAPNGSRALAVSRKGDQLIATATSLGVYPAGATYNDPPSRLISGARTGLAAAGGVRDVALDGRGWIWAVTANGVLGFAPGATGDVAPAARIWGSRTGLRAPRHVDVDAANRVYVTDAARRSISAFAPTANGNVRPLRVLRGTKASINPREAAVALNGRIVTTRGSRAIQVFSTMFPKRPSAVRSVRVTGKTRAAKRKVRWAKPADNGGGAVQKYKLVFRKGSKVVKRVTLKPGRRSYTVKKSALRRGKLTVTVRANNIGGWSPKVVKRFRVR